MLVLCVWGVGFLVCFVLFLWVCCGVGGVLCWVWRGWLRGFLVSVWF